MKIDRKLQKEILQTACTKYPQTFRQSDLNLFIHSDTENQNIIGNLLYLEMHGLIELDVKVSSDGMERYTFVKLRPTAKAFDFLADDGGLSSIFGVVTVKLHADTIKDLIESKICEADIPQDEKHHLLQAIKTLSDEALKHLTTKAIDLVFDNPMAIFQLLKTLAAL